MTKGDEFPVTLYGKEVGIAREIRDGIVDIVITDDQAVADFIGKYRMYDVSIVEKDKGLGKIELV